MLDLFTIFSKSGIVLWYFQGTTQLLTNSVNELIKSVILQERGLTSAWDHDQLSLQYKLDNEFELIFVVAYQNILKLTYIDKFLTEIALRFRDKYKQEIVGAQFGHDFCDFRRDFDQILARCEREAERRDLEAPKPRKYEESSKSTKTVASMIETKKSGGILNSIVSTVSGGVQPTAGEKKQQAKNKGGVENGHRMAEVPVAEEENGQVENNGGVEILEDFEKKPAVKTQRTYKPKGKGPASPKSPGQEPKKGKKGTEWEPKVDINSLCYNDEEVNKNNNNTNSPGQNSEIIDVNKFVDKKDIGKLKGDLKSIDVDDVEIDEDQYNDDEVNNNNTKKSVNSSKKSNAGGGLFSSLKGLVGGKMLTADVIEPVMEKMQDHLVAKNVAAEIAKKVCDNVAQNLEGKQLGSFQFATSIIKQALHESMVQILTPKKRVDILRDVYESQRQQRPYVIVFCGVNGVGKSTNLAKVTFWLIENSFRVLIAACDTFRSGAVEQLKTHVRHLNALHPAEKHNGKQMVDLFEKGYGKDAAAIAHDAINQAKENRQDVVLVDTAGRMQDNEPLMKALAKLININNPDLVLFVGEALVGNEAVDQVRKFNQALIDNSPVKTTNPERVRTIDGIVLTKFDTIDDKVGAAISMTYTTGQPIVFVGTGQTYSDLKSLNAQSVVKSLLK